MPERFRLDEHGRRREKERSGPRDKQREAGRARRKRDLTLTGILEERASAIIHASSPPRCLPSRISRNLARAQEERVQRRDRTTGAFGDLPHRELLEVVQFGGRENRLRALPDRRPHEFADRSLRKLVDVRVDRITTRQLRLAARSRSFESRVPLPQFAGYADEPGTLHLHGVDAAPRGDKPGVLRQVVCRSRVARVVTGESAQARIGRGELRGCRIRI